MGITKSRTRLVIYMRVKGHTGVALLHEAYKSGSTKRRCHEPDTHNSHPQTLPSPDCDDASVASPSARSSFRMNASRASKLTDPNTTSIASKLSPLVSGIRLTKRQRVSARTAKTCCKPYRAKTAMPPMLIVAKSMKSL